MNDQPAAPLDVSDQRDDTELARLSRSRAASDDALDRSLDRLDQVVRTAGRDTIAGSLPPAASAVYRVLEAYGFDAARRGIDVARLHAADTIEQGVEACGSRARQIILPAEWWRRDHGHLVAMLRPDGEAGEASGEETPIALIRRTSGRYELFDTARGERVRVGAQLARRIAPYAYEVVPPLPARVGGLVDLAHYVLPMIRGDILWVLLAGALGGLIGTVIPIATAVIIDTLIPGQELSLLIQVGVALMLAALVNMSFSLVQQHALTRIAGRAGVVMDAAVWDRVLRLPASFFKDYASGDLSTRIMGVGALRSAIVSVALSATIAAVFSFVYLGLMLVYDARLALVALALVVTLTVITIGVGLLQIKYHKRQVEISGWLSGYVFQILQAIVKLRVAGAEERAFVRWADKYTDERAAILSARRLNNHFAAFSDAYGILALALIFAAAAKFSEVDLSAGIFIAFLAAFGSFQGAFMGLGRALLRIVEVWPDWERARPILQAEMEAPVHAADPGRLEGRVELTNITFGYDDKAPVLEDVSLAVAPGEHVALVGPSGSGKSTLVRVILGLEQPGRGTVLFDGQDLAGLDPTLVRRQIGVVTQTGRLMAGSIMENVRGASDLSYEDCLAACIAAGLEDDLRTFPMGLHTPLTEGGTTLSGGQRQRLLIARALVNRPRILVFDEATSALDNRTQAIVTESLNRLDVTRIVVAHRLSTIRDADRIFVLDAGKVRERGTYDELMQADGLFRRLAERQLA